LHLDRLRALHPADGGGRGPARRALVVGAGRAEGVRHPLRDRDRRARARAARARRRGRVTIELKGEAREVALAEVQATLAMARGDDMRARLAELAAQLDAGAVDGDGEELLESVLELGQQAGRIRAHYGPGGEQAAVATLRRLPRGRERAESARAVSTALQALVGRQLGAISIQAVGPGAFALQLEADGVEAAVRLDQTGARLASVGS